MHVDGKLNDCYVKVKQSVHAWIQSTEDQFVELLEIIVATTEQFFV